MTINIKVSDQYQGVIEPAGSPQSSVVGGTITTVNSISDIPANANGVYSLPSGEILSYVGGKRTKKYGSPISSGTIVQNFNNGLADVTIITQDAGSTFTESATVVKNGSKSVAIKKTTGALGANRFDFNTTDFILESDTTVNILAFCKNHAGGSAAIYVSNAANAWTNYCTATSAQIYQQGIDVEGSWILFTVNATQLLAGIFGTLITTGSTINKMRMLFGSCNTSTEIYIDSVYITPISTPKIPISFDDGYISQYRDAYTYLTKKGLIGSIVIPPGLIGPTDRVSVDNLRDMYNAGWDVISHTYTHKYAITGHGVTANGGPMDQICGSQTVTAGASFIINGTVGLAAFDQPRHIVLNNGINNSNKRFTITGIDEFGNTVTEVLIGMNLVPNPSYTVWTRIISIVADDGITGSMTIGQTPSYQEMYDNMLLAKNWMIANGFTRSLNIYCPPAGQVTRLSKRATIALGYIAHRLTSVNYEVPSVTAANWGMSGVGGGIANGGSATLIAVKNTAKTQYQNVGIYLHEIVADSNATPTSTQARIADFRLLIDSISADEKSKLIECPRYSDYVNDNF